MKIPNTYLCALVTSLVAFACIQGAYAEDDDCCGDTKYDPLYEECCHSNDGTNLFPVPIGTCCGGGQLQPGEECCGGDTPVPIGTCCKGTQLEEGKQCCKDGVEFQNPYDPETECCVNPYARVLSKFEFSDYTECVNRVPREGGGSDGDGICSVPGGIPEGYKNDPVSYNPLCQNKNSSFLPACLVHDKCFGHCQPGEATAAFNACNQAFDDHIESICNDLDTAYCRTHCHSYRIAYVQGVKSSIGRGRFDTGQTNACQCCP